MDYEVELKFRVDASDDLEGRMQCLGAAEAASLQQRDTYFAHPQRDFGQTDEAFRIRSVGEANRLTYKGPKIDPDTKTRREVEVSIAEGADARERMAEILRSLGFRALLTVAKHRRVYRLRWEDRDIELALDTVAGLGTFAEIETIASQSTWPAAKDSIGRLAAQLQLQDSERRSYLELLLPAESG